ncbi:hypothetical protein J6590_018735 [Homalodisca vitripennis]|nr:hypothetical protein J6590_018735 [Homalodisca vitripennis]
MLEEAMSPEINKAIGDSKEEFDPGWDPSALCKRCSSAFGSRILSSMDWTTRNYGMANEII